MHIQGEDRSMKTMKSCFTLIAPPSSPAYTHPPLSNRSTTAKSLLRRGVHAQAFVLPVRHGAENRAIPIVWDKKPELPPYRKEYKYPETLAPPSLSALLSYVRTSAGAGTPSSGWRRTPTLNRTRARGWRSESRRSASRGTSGRASRTKPPPSECRLRVLCSRARVGACCLSVLFCFVFGWKPAWCC